MKLSRFIWDVNEHEKYELESRSLAGGLSPFMTGNLIIQQTERQACYLSKHCVVELDYFIHFTQKRKIFY